MPPVNARTRGHVSAQLPMYRMLISRYSQVADKAMSQSSERRGPSPTKHLHDDDTGQQRVHDRADSQGRAKVSGRVELLLGVGHQVQGMLRLARHRGAHAMIGPADQHDQRDDRDRQHDPRAGSARHRIINDHAVGNLNDVTHVNYIGPRRPHLHSGRIKIVSIASAAGSGTAVTKRLSKSAVSSGAWKLSYTSAI